MFWNNGVNPGTKSLSIVQILIYGELTVWFRAGGHFRAQSGRQGGGHVISQDGQLGGVYKSTKRDKAVCMHQAKTTGDGLPAFSENFEW